MGEWRNSSGLTLAELKAVTQAAEEARRQAWRAAPVGVGVLRCPPDPDVELLAQPARV